MNRDVSRRDALKAGAATAGVTALAGCSTITDAIPFIGGGNYTDWAFEPGTIGDSDHLLVSYTDFSTVVENESEFNSDYYDESFEGQEDAFPLEPTNLNVEDVSTSVSISGLGGRIAADYNQDDVDSELGDNDYDDDTDHEGYTIYLGPDEARAIGIDGNNLVYGSTGFGTDADPVDIVEALIDTKNGNEDRYVDDSEGFATMTDQFGSPTFAYGSTQEPAEETDAENGQFEGNVAGGLAATVNGGTTDVMYVAVFENEGDVDVGDIQDYADSDQFDDLNDVSTNQNGTAVLITGQVDTDELGETLN